MKPSLGILKGLQKADPQSRWSSNLDLQRICGKIEQALKLPTERKLLQQERHNPFPPHYTPSSMIGHLIRRFIKSVRRPGHELFDKDGRLFENCLIAASARRLHITRRSDIMVAPHLKGLGRN